MTDRETTRAALEDAIRAHLATYEAGHGVLTDWLLIAAQEHVNDNNLYTSSIAVVTPNDRYPMHRILGLLDHATVTMHSMMAASHPEAE